MLNAAYPVTWKTGLKEHANWASALGMLFSRIILFAAWQAVFAAGAVIAGSPDPWQTSITWWPVSMIFANLTVLFLLWRLNRAEGGRFFDLFKFDKKNIGPDLLVLSGIFVISGIVGGPPGPFLSLFLFGDAVAASELMIHPLPVWAAIPMVVLFPVTIAITELPTYFGYVQPRLQALTGKFWPAYLSACLMLAAQHISLPLIFDGQFILYRLLMFLPFAFFVGFVLNWRPRLFPYMVILHALIDLSLAVLILAESV